MTALFSAGSVDVLYIVDLSSYVLRAYHAIAPLTSPSGEPTHAVHGTVNMLERLVRQCKPALFSIAMDSGRQTFRKEIYDAYKANRPPAPMDLRQQMARCEQLVRAFNIPIFKQDGVEADDLIASAVKAATERELRVVIVAADKDLMQLVSERVIQWDTMRDRVFGPTEVEERFGVRVDQLRDLLALMGDSSDNIPGVPGVGPKTAQELLVAHGSLEGIYRDLEQIKKKGLRDKLAEHREQAFLSQRLVTLKDDCPITLDAEHLRYGGRNVPELRKLYAELGFQRQLQALASEPVEGAAATTGIPEPAARAALGPIAAPQVRVLNDAAELTELANEARRAGRFGLAVETSDGSSLRGGLVGVALAVERGAAVYLPLGHRYMGAPKQLPLEQVKNALGPLLADPKVCKFALDLKR
ncbi:MAG TPA: 5'-3' exonuclease H3TH domain-containing protein, partial [Polyangiaceae bacterium]